MAGNDDSYDDDDRDPRRSADPGPETPATRKHDPYAALRHRSYALFLGGSFVLSLGRQMVVITVGLQIYAWTKSAAALGLLGFVNVAPLLALALPAGHLADRWDRRRILMTSYLVQAVICGLLGSVTLFSRSIPDYATLHAGNDALRAIAGFFERHETAGEVHFDQPALPLIYVLLLIASTARVIAGPARAAFIPQLLPLRDFSNAVTWSSSAFEFANVAGPVIGGVIAAGPGYAAVYFFEAVAALIFAVLLTRVRAIRGRETISAAPESRAWSAGVRFIWSRKIILAAVSLDLFAVLLGSVIVILPNFADTVFGSGAIAVGWMRAAPAFGAAAMAISQAHLPPMHRPGIVLLWAVAIFGVALIAFGLSPWLWLSLVFLFLSGAADNISVIVRQSLVQLLTPDEKRGRVSAVNQIFIGSSNEIGALRAGFVAAALGPVAAVVSGGIGTILVVLSVALLSPALRKLEPLHRLRAE